MHQKAASLRFASWGKGRRLTPASASVTMAPHFEQEASATVMKRPVETKEQPEASEEDVVLRVTAKNIPLLLHVDKNQAVTSPVPVRRRKRDVLRQVSMRLYLKGKHVADDVLRNVAPSRLADAEEVCGDAQSSLEHEILHIRR
ncbi:Hypothetical protein PHPALM_1671 [Phytophthora palmivora]|uniref:Uncharacterized protein n=1 Tax=Phytophthora palmivora TaxID=4796 RepID=A0A2P4YRP7_9STRA|nr:Hypothetical protein PHPALM_1671 [Phytophthora palmivora]